MSRRGRYDIINEQMILASMMQSKEDRRRILGFIQSKHIQSPRHKVIYDSIKKCVQHGLIINPNSIAIHASDDFGGLEYLEKLLTIKRVDDLKYNLFRMKQEAARIEAIKEIDRAKERLSDRSLEYYQYVKSVGQVMRILTESVNVQRSENIGQKWKEEFRNRCLGNVPFVSTGYRTFDLVLTQGFFKGGLTVIAGRTRVGKSMLIADMTRRLVKIKPKLKILVLPLEGDSMVFMDLLISSATKIEHTLFMKRPEEITDKDKIRINRSINKMFGKNRKLEVLDNPFISLSESGNWTYEAAMDRMEQLLAEGGYDIVIVDLWERILASLDPRIIAASLVKQQSLCLKYMVHLILVHQLQRRVEDRSRDKSRRPTLIDLKNSGAYEEVADQVLLVHRERLYKPFISKDIIEIKLAKQKKGEDGITVLANFYPQFSRLEDDRIADVDEVLSSKVNMIQEDLL